MNFGLYYPPFHLDKEKSSTTGPRWMEWINGFDLMLNNCCVAEADKLPLLLRFVGRGVRDISTTLKLEEKRKNGDPYVYAKRTLAEHFRRMSLSNLTFQRYLFTWLRQRSDESFEAFHLRAKDVAQACDFKSDFDRRVRDQIVLGCRSDDIRRQGFMSDYGLDDILRVGRDLRDESDTGLLTSGGDVISVFLPDSAVSLFREAAASSLPHDDPNHRSPPSQQQQQQPTNGTSDARPIVHRVPAAGVSTAVRPKDGGAPGDPLSHFDDLSLANSSNAATAALSREERRKEKAKERRRQQRREFVEAIKTKPLEELTDKQRKFHDYQQKVREKWSERKALRKKNSGAAGGSGSGSGAVAAVGCGGDASGSALEGNDEADDGVKYASDDDDDDEEEEFVTHHIDVKAENGEER